MVTTPAVSVGHALDLVSAGVGVVHSVFAHAVNIEMRGDLWTLLAAGKADLPFGIRTTLRCFEGFGLREDEAGQVRSGFVGISNRLVVDCRAAAQWVPACQNKREPGLPGRLDWVATAARDRSWHRSAQMACAVTAALGDPHALDEVLAEVVGCGPGLTPSGDDVLVGILAVVTSPHSGEEGAEAAALLGESIRPLLPTTTDVSAHLLRQAADGLVSRPVHELVSALIGNPTRERLNDAVQRVIETGATSGADTCEGMLACAPAFFLTHHHRAVA